MNQISHNGPHFCYTFVGLVICEVGIIACRLLENIEMLRKLTILQQKNVRFGVHQIHTYSLLVFAKIVPFAFYPGSSCVILYSEALVACKCVMCLINKQLFGPPFTWIKCSPCKSNHMSSKVLNEISYPIPNFNGYSVEVWELISNFIPHFCNGCNK